MKNYGLDRTQLKILAIIAMVVDHTAWGFVDFMSPLGQFMHIFGRLTLPIMCFFIAEGYRHTKNLQEYIYRMLAFSAISIIPFYIFFHEEYGYRQNIIFDLTLALLCLCVSEGKIFKKWMKICLIALLVLISFVIGGWVVMPIIYVFIFYYGKDFKDKAIKFTGATVLMSAVLSVMIVLNQQYHFSQYDWTVQERLYLLGFVFALIPLYFYNGERGKDLFGGSGIGRYFFYIFYPSHFLLLAYIRHIIHGYTLQNLYIDVHVIALLIALIILSYVLTLHTTRAQMAVTFFMTCAVMYLFGFLMEITTYEIEGVYTATKLQYFAECFVFVAITLCIQELTHTRLPYPVYVFEFIFSTFVMYCMFTWRENHLLYKDIIIDYDGPFPRMYVVEYGIVFYAFVLYCMVICLMAVGVGFYSLRNHDNLQRKRLRLLLLGMITMWIPYISKMVGLFDKYEIPALTIPFTAYFVVLSLKKYSYLDSVALDFSNAINRGNEGILVVDRNFSIMYHNEVVHQLFGQFMRFDSARNVPGLYKALTSGESTITKDGHTYETRVEPLTEQGHNIGSILWIFDLTEHFEYLSSIEKSANTDSLTGLLNRKAFEKKVGEALERKEGGSFFMVDLDNFKHVNDNHGHDAGDIILTTLSNVIKQEQTRDMNHNLIAGRIGGDEFALYYEGITDKRALSNFAHLLIDNFDNKLLATAYPGVTSISLGISMTGGSELAPSKTYNQLYKEADEALYIAKGAGKKTFAFR